MTKYQEISLGLKKIGKLIESWRDDISARELLDPKAFKTQADMTAHALIVELIKSIDGQAVIVSEEDFDEGRKRDSAYWIIDPIDGTASWYGGYRGFVTQVAFVEDEKPVFAAVYAPVLDKLWTAERNKGAFLNNNKLEGACGVISEINLVDNYPEPKHIAKTISENFPIKAYIESGSIGLKSCLVADGTADLFVKDVVIRDWDVAPAMLILEELGGVVSDLKGNPIVLNGSFDKNNGLLVARNMELARRVIEFVKLDTND